MEKFITIHLNTTLENVYFFLSSLESRYFQCIVWLLVACGGGKKTIKMECGNVSESKNNNNNNKEH